MIWQEVFFNRLLTTSEIINSIAHNFNLDKEAIMIVKNLEDAEVNESVKVLCQTFIVPTEFPLKVSIYIFDQRLIPTEDTLRIAEMCELLMCYALISDNQLNPYSMLFIKSVSDIQQCFLDNIDQYDNAEEYETL